MTHQAGLAAARTAVQRFTSDADRWAIGEAAIEAYLGASGIGGDGGPTLGAMIAVARPDDLEEKDWKGWDLAMQAMIRAHREASRSLKARPLTADRSSSMAVKGLEWSDKIETHWFAATVLGNYSIVEWGGRYGLSAPNVQFDRSFPSLDEAKAAAQSDYASRIRSALVDHTGGVKETSEAGRHR